MTIAGASACTGDGEAAVCGLVGALFGNGFFQAQVFRAVEQFEQLALFHAVDLVARAFDLGPAHLITQSPDLGFGFARRLPRRLVELGAVLEAIPQNRDRSQTRGRNSNHNRCLDQRFHQQSPCQVRRSPPMAGGVTPASKEPGTGSIVQKAMIFQYFRIVINLIQRRPCWSDWTICAGTVASRAVVSRPGLIALLITLPQIV